MCRVDSDMKNLDGENVNDCGDEIKSCILKKLLKVWRPKQYWTV